MPLLQRAVSIVFGEGHEDEHDIMHACHSSVHIVLLDKVTKCHRRIITGCVTIYVTDLRLHNQAVSFCVQRKGRAVRLTISLQFCVIEHFSGTRPSCVHSVMPKYQILVPNLRWRAITLLLLPLLIFRASLSRQFQAVI